MSDEKFMTDLLTQIAKYARKNRYSVDETIKTISNNFLELLEIATFEDLGKEKEKKRMIEMKWYPLKATMETDENDVDYWHVEGQLPEENEEVLISTKYGVFFDIFVSDEFECFFEDHDFDEVIAWMHVPEPYKEESEEEE